MTDQTEQLLAVPALVVSNKTSRMLEVFISRNIQDVDLVSLNRGSVRPGNETLSGDVIKKVVLSGTQTQVPWFSTNAFLTVIAQSSSGEGDHVPYHKRIVNQGQQLTVREEKFSEDSLIYYLPMPSEEDGPPGAAPAGAPSGPPAVSAPLISPWGAPSPMGMGMPMGMPPGMPLGMPMMSGAPAPVRTTIQRPIQQYVGQSITTINPMAMGGQTIMEVK
mmetsp:Transcript_37537/g.77019  ORF Transcript_37537/g.77019 Transcript_37537/m.77019 type:complete len:219 (-) Transcript_37537:121-777(-)|eukprot:CAMPEP_0181325710 /NCGR_PEP_ID=MMETSP1101-20121128/21083_1 /TAXON_ID=46948 /ORGANISM="Rhodomonas abbreviata, Strain Caron Lab Isolate" /LENGTH=218 /DNA_ID=CAMNT_0023434061 /DNA_START=65 /DNA_END=721 /DNA_ORIENTATION=+